MEIIGLSPFVRSHKQTRKVCVRERAGTVWRMAGGAEQAGGPPDSVAPQLFNRPARNFRSRVTDLTPDDLFPSTKRTLQLDDGEGDDSRREDSRRAFPPCSSSPSAGSCRIDRGHCRASACSPGCRGSRRLHRPRTSMRTRRRSARRAEPRCPQARTHSASTGLERACPLAFSRTPGCRWARQA